MIEEDRALTLDFDSHFPEWHHVLFNVKDADSSIRFYSGYLGMSAVLDERDADGIRWVWLRFSENPYAPLFVLIENTHLKTHPGNLSSFQSFSFRFPDLKPVEEISSRAQKENCLVEAAQYGGHMKGYFCKVSDPDGNLMEFTYVLTSKPGHANG
jgi:catechol 2,3-dioxygenase-like lactoylglutathione lyase family enzyme